MTTEVDIFEARLDKDCAAAAIIGYCAGLLRHDLIPAAHADHLRDLILLHEKATLRYRTMESNRFTLARSTN